MLMPRKKKEQQQVTYLIPKDIFEPVNKMIENDAFYKHKPIWKQKLYHLFEYIALQNIDNELGPTSDYVNINMERTAKILAVNNKQMAKILKDCVSNRLLRKDGIMKKAVKVKVGKRTIYLEQGKSYGYQFNVVPDLIEVTIDDNRSLYSRNVHDLKKLANSQEDLRAYQEVLSQISIDTEGLEETFKQILENKAQKTKMLESYRKFIREQETNNNQKNNFIFCTIIPFAGVIVPEKVFRIDEISESQNSAQCKLCKFKTKPFHRKRVEKIKVIESDETTIARCKKSVISINSGYMVAQRPVEASRVYCDITNLKRELRKHIRLAGKKVAGIDIRNSQPLIACIPIRKYWLDKQGYLPEDVIRYQEACENGSFYDGFMKALNLPHELRGQFKEDFFGKVFFSMVIEKDNLLKSMFIEQYPSVWEMVCDEKGGLYSRDYSDFANKLQKVEATIIFDCVNMTLIRNGIKAFNIFDSIYITSKEDQKEAIRLMQKVFNAEGISPTFNMENEEHLYAKHIMR